MTHGGQPGPRGAAFLLAQVGAHASERFANRVQQIGLSPAEVGLLRMISRQPGRSQQAVAVELGVVPSRVVVLIDSLGHKGLVERRPGTTDRRHHELYLTVDGERTMIDMRSIATAHDDDLLAALDPEERVQLKELLQRVADQQGLTPGVHPGYRQAGGRRKPSASAGATGHPGEADAARSESTQTGTD
ncbi:MarR family winged helix-turn-helix transcriptional regulator [Dactylosporangium sp. CA-139066]|uniref:MarR family winged helix-turn-helix transcriptional regulator n=1 Tax=Dactylosporangium sp. CA-139066 TaxID=3239930 RepID=UPI003D9183FF